MSTIPTHLQNQIRALFRSSGTQGGHLSPSVYDTAQVLRYGQAEPACREAMINWLLEQQHPDGGWGDPTRPATRELPTLATMLALHSQAPTCACHEALARGRAFMAQQHYRWPDPLPDDIPVGIELLLPPLVCQASAAGLITPYPITPLIALGTRRRQRLGSRPVPAGSTLSHSWEALEVPADPQVCDGSGGVGHSPAATAAWLATTPTPDHAFPARAYLAAASAATGTVGLQPTVWPIDYFELLWVLYAFGCAGLLSHPAIRDWADGPLQRLAAAMTPNGLGMSRYFMHDGDITATALVTLQLAGMPADVQLLDRFAVSDHFVTYPYELQPSLSTTAHAVQALALTGRRDHPALRFLAEHQLADGRWDHDKWHSSWLYTTGVMLHTLIHLEVRPLIEQGLQALVQTRHRDGGWGSHGCSTTAETAYAFLAAHAAQRAGYLVDGLGTAIHTAGAWLMQTAPTTEQAEPLLWIGKELYKPYRIDAAFVGAAQLLYVLDIEDHAVTG
ncbi:MAG: prenyltransferase/squalene oxidase repeat-containing protein [Oscillochloridaceae bacterium umkhey_bin13]